MKTEKEFLTELETAMELRESEYEEAKESLLQVVAGNPIFALHQGVRLAEAVLSRIRGKINERKREVENASE
jgi:hypothetical protein